MQPTCPTAPPSGTPPLPPGTPDFASRLQIGQILNAVVAKDSEKGQTLLQLGTRLLLARTGELQLSQGQRLQLQVAALGELPLLRLISSLRQDPVADILRRILPEQRPLPQGLGALVQAASQEGETQLPPRLVTLIRELLQALPDGRRAATPESLRQALERSGQFLEARLAATATGKAPANPAQDFQAGLLRLAAALEKGVAAQKDSPSRETPAGASPARPTQATQAGQAAQAASTRPAAEPANPRALLRPGQPPFPQPSVSLETSGRPSPPLQLQDLLGLVRATLSRIKLNQVASLPQDRQHPPEWVIELPLRNQGSIDIWSLRILRRQEEGKARNRERASPVWSVLLAFDLPGLGPMQARVTLAGEDRIRALFLGEGQADLPRVERQLPRLRERLEAAGLVVESLGCRRGRLQALPPRTGAGPLLDEKA
ncbi:MAG TPA: flagellar hook-length control protein FliK [Thiotrichales bacterium]|nr:flagellar hook-length control protein FliK [Thiotrichales bacterium]